jgi:hypothetical protein
VTTFANKCQFCYWSFHVIKRHFMHVIKCQSRYLLDYVIKYHVMSYHVSLDFSGKLSFKSGERGEGWSNMSS